MRIEKTEDAGQVNRVFAVAFHASPDRGPAGKGREIRHWGAFDGERMMATVSAERFSMNFDGNLCPMAGIGGVATLPQYRNRGCIREIFRKVLPELYDEGYEFSYLYAFSNAFYRQFGYESCVQLLEMTVDLRQLRPPGTEGSWIMNGPEISGAIAQLDRLWEQRYNMMVVGQKQTEKNDDQHTYVWLDSAGIPKAYTSFRRVPCPTLRGYEELELRCSRFRFTDRESFQALMGLFRTMSADSQRVIFSLPAGCSMEYLLPEWSMHAADWRIQTAGMVRVIRVMDVLRKARYRGSGDLVIQVTDPLIPDNTGCYRIRFADGKAVSVDRTEAEPAAVLTIETFSALISGVADLDQAGQWMQGLEIRQPGAEALFYRKPRMVNVFF